MTEDFARKITLVAAAYGCVETLGAGPCFKEQERDLERSRGGGREGEGGAGSNLEEEGGGVLSGSEQCNSASSEPLSASHAFG